MAAFTWGAGGAQLTPEQIAERQKVAQALIERGSDTSPIQHWSQGANRVIQGLMGGYDSYKNDEATKANADANKEMIAALLGGMSGGTAPVATTTAPAPLAVNPPAMTGGAPSPVAMAPSVNNKIYSNDEPSPLDPPMGKDRDLAIRTVYGEDPGSSALGVANVIRNRAVAGKFGGDTIPGVVLAKNQFEPWNNDAARARMQSLDPNSPTYKRLGEVVDQAYTGTNDPTNGATHFFAPKAQAALGRSVPKWGQQGGQDIGVHRFFGGAANPTMVATNAVPPAADMRAGAPVQPSQTTWGDREAEAAGLYEQPATVAQRSVGAPGAPADPAALPANATPAQYVAPGTGQVMTPAAVAPARPQMSSAALAAVVADPRASPAVQKIAGMMLQQAMKPNDTTDEIKEYNLAASQDKAAGKSPQSFTDWKIGMKKAGAIQNSVQIDQKGESEFSKESGKLQAKRFNELADDAPAAKQMLSDVEVLKELGSKIETGKGAEVRAAIGPYAQALGIDVKGLDEIQAYEAVVNRVAPNLRVKGSGAQSDFELKNFMKSLPSIGNTPGGNEMSSRVLEGLYQNKLTAAEIGAKALNGEITRSQAEKAIRDLPDPMKEWREFKKQEKATPPAASTAPDRTSIEVEMRRRGLLK